MRHARRLVFAGVESGIPVCETPERDLCRLRDTIRSLVNSMYDQGDGSLSMGQYYDYRKQIMDPASVADLRTLVLPWFHADGWTDDLLREAGVLPAETSTAAAPAA